MRFHRFRTTYYANAHIRNLACWSYIFKEEMIAGTRFMRQGSNVYVYLGMTQEVLSMSQRSERITAYLNQVYGLTQTDAIGKFCFASMRDYAITEAVKTELRRFMAFNTITKTAYLSTYNGRMWKIDGGTPTIVPNGEDDVFFIDDDGGTTIEPDIGPHGMLLDKLTTLNYADSGIGGINAEQQRKALTVWLFMLAFPDLMPTKPLLIVEGTQGSGKSACVQLIQLAILGASKPMILSKNKEDDFGVLLLRSPIAVFDNTDSFIEWVPDAICSYATLGYWVKRKLYSDDDELKLKPHAFIAVATKNPASFRREDVADRCIILRLERLSEFARFEKLQSDILAARSQLLGEYIWYVNQLVHRMRVYADEEHMETTRMADFASFARVIGEELHWTKEEVSDLMAALSAEQLAFIAEEDPLNDLLHKWIVYRGGGFSNIGRERTLHELHAELESFSQAQQMPYYKSARTLAQKLRSPHVEKEFDVEVIIRDSRKIYKIWRKTDPKLMSVALPPTPSMFNEDGEIIEFG